MVKRRISTTWPETVKLLSMNREMSEQIRRRDKTRTVNVGPVMHCMTDPQQWYPSTRTNLRFAAENCIGIATAPNKITKYLSYGRETARAYSRLLAPGENNEFQGVFSFSSLPLPFLFPFCRENTTFPGDFSPGEMPRIITGYRAKLDTFSINIQRYSQNHAQNWIFAPPCGVIMAIYALYLKVLTQEDFVAEFHQENASFTRKTAN